MADKPVLDLLARMTADSLEVSSLDPESIMLVRIAALISVDAPPASYLLNLGMASEMDIDAEQVRAVLAAVAPIVGTARVASAAGNIARALGLALDLAELEAEAERTWKEAKLEDQDFFEGLAHYMERRHGVRVRVLRISEMGDAVRRFDDALASYRKVIEVDFAHDTVRVDRPFVEARLLRRPRREERFVLGDVRAHAFTVARHRLPPS
jgi:hypothetical protein